jgi:hypothetical protein
MRSLAPSLLALLLSGCLSTAGLTGGPANCNADLQTDAHNCGACGHDCAGAACMTGLCEPTVLFASLAHPACVAVDALNVYWGTGSATASSAPKAGGKVTQLANGAGIDAVVDCLVDGTSFYVMTGNGIFAYTLANGTQQDLVYGQSGLRALTEATNPPFLFFTSNLEGFIGSCDLANQNACGTMANPLATMLNGPYKIAADGARVYWTDRGDGTVMSIAPGVSTVAKVLATGESGPGGIAVDAMDVYWVTQDGHVMKAGKGGGAASSIVAGQAGAESIALDDQHVFWVTATGGNVMRAAKDGTGLLTLATGQDNPWALALDNTYVYWANNADPGSILRVAK